MPTKTKEKKVVTKKKGINLSRAQKNFIGKKQKEKAEDTGKINLTISRDKLTDIDGPEFVTNVSRSWYESWAELGFNTRRDDPSYSAAIFKTLTKLSDIYGIIDVPMLLSVINIIEGEDAYSEQLNIAMHFVEQQPEAEKKIIKKNVKLYS